MSQLSTHIMRLCAVLPLTLLLTLTSCATETDQASKTVVQIAYTGNLNGILDDCQCGGELVGGFTRIISVVNELRAVNAGLLLLDAGDFLSSYSMPRSNAIMMALVAKARFDAINPGDQEFVEGQQFLRKHAQWPVMLSSNLRIPGVVMDSLRIMNRNNVQIAIMSMTDADCFSFIKSDDLKIKPIETALQRLQVPAMEQADLQILLLHADWERAIEIANTAPWLDLIILANNQRRDYLQMTSTTIVEAGVNGEHVGLLELTLRDGNWHGDNRFIPITEDVVEEATAYELVQDYYRTLSAGYR